MRGLEVKEDTYATLTVRTAQNKPIPLVDAGMPDGLNSSGYANFLLQGVSEARMEKHQIIETFGASYVFFFGEQPRFLDVSAQLLNSNDFNWEAEWWANYNTYLRGTKLVELGARCYLAYDDNIVEGYIMMAQANKVSAEPHLVTLQFKFFVTNCTNVSNVGNPNYPIRQSALIPEDLQLTSLDAGRLLVSNLRDEARGQAELENFDDRGQIAAQTIRQGLPGGNRTISQLMRQAPASFAVAADWWPLLESRGAGNLAGLRNLVIRANKPIRELIAANTDEYLGRGDARTQFGYEPGEQPRPPSALKAITRDVFEANDLFRQSVEMLGCYGANINSPDAFSSMGFRASFSTGASAGAGASFGASLGGSSGASFSAGSGVGLGAVAGGRSGFSAVAETRLGVSARAGVSALAGFNSSFQSDSLGAVYGRRSTSERRFSRDSQRMTQIGKDFSYGYESDYAKRPGFGRAGYGDYGGNGFGSSNRSGDPGFKDPSRFTFAGVAEEASAFERFQRANQDRTALTDGTVAGRGVLTGGASVDVGGQISAFALVSVEGTLNILGTAREDPMNISARREAQKFGFSTDNPFGVNCARPGGSGLSSGVGFSATSRAGVSSQASVSASVGALLSVGASTGVGF